MTIKNTNFFDDTSRTHYRSSGYQKVKTFSMAGNFDTKNESKRLIKRRGDYQKYHWSPSAATSAKLELDVDAIERRNKFYELNERNKR